DARARARVPALGVRDEGRAARGRLVTLHRGRGRGGGTRPRALARPTTRLGFDLYPYTEDAVAAVKRSVLQWRFIDGVAAKIDDAALREAQFHKDAVRAYEIVYAALGA